MAMLGLCDRCEKHGLTVRVWPGDPLHSGPKFSVSRICVACMSSCGVNRRQLNSRIRRDDHRDDVEAVGLGLLSPIAGEIVVAPAGQLC